MTITEQIADASGAPGVRIPGFTGQGWSTHETMLVVRWLFAHPGAWDQAMAVARAEPGNPHTVADTLHEKLVPRSELDQIAAQGFDPAKVNWLEIGHELIERRDDPQPGIAAQALGLATDDAGAAPDGDADDAPMLTAHWLDDTTRHLAQATQRMQAARESTGKLRQQHAGHIARHLQAALDATHDLAANIRAHYPAEAAELEQVKQAIGLAKAVSGEAKAATTAHLLETTLHEETHGIRHAQAMTGPTPDAEWEFNADHAEKHLAGAVEHAGKLRQHMRDNYPPEAKHLAGLDEITSGAGQDGKPQHARYSKGTVSAQLASPMTITGQAAVLLATAEATKISVGVAGPPDQVASFVQLCKTIQVLGEVGASRTVQIDVDGDGNASLSFTFGSLDDADVKAASFDSDPVRVPGIGG